MPLPDSIEPLKDGDVTAILVSGGVGTRMGGPIPKQYLPLGGKPIARHSFDLFRSLPEIGQIIVVCDEDYQHLFVDSNSDDTVVFASPGPRRQDSVYNALAKVRPQACLLLTHDAVRPFVDAAMVRQVLYQGAAVGAATAAVPVTSTIKVADDDDCVCQTLDRSRLWEIQTPQGIRPDLLRRGFDKANREQIAVTDCCSLVELVGAPVRLVRGSRRNIKITVPEDLTIAEALWASSPSHPTEVCCCGR